MLAAQALGFGYGAPSAAISTSRCGRRDRLPARAERIGQDDAVQDHAGPAPGAGRPCAAARRDIGACPARRSRAASPTCRRRTWRISRSACRHGGDGAHGAPRAVRRAHARPTGARRRRRWRRSASRELAEAEYTRISGGQRQLALVARALAQDAPAIVMDEPTANLDFGNQVGVLSEVKRLAARARGAALHARPRPRLQHRRPRGLDGQGPLVAQGAPVDVLTPARCARSTASTSPWNASRGGRSCARRTTGVRG